MALWVHITMGYKMHMFISLYRVRHFVLDILNLLLLTPHPHPVPVFFQRILFVVYSACISATTDRVPLADSLEIQLLRNTTPKNNFFTLNKRSKIVCCRRFIEYLSNYI